MVVMTKRGPRRNIPICSSELITTTTSWVVTDGSYPRFCVQRLGCLLMDSLSVLSSQKGAQGMNTIASHI